MRLDWPLLLGVSLALIALGALIGELWARLRSSRGVERKPSQRPHYLLGLNYLVSHQPGHAIRELSRAVRQETDAVEAYLALGNLLRENGQTERAIDLHKSLLHRPGLSEWERTQVLFSLAMDFKKAGLIDRAERTFNEVAHRAPENLGCLYALQRIAEETGRWGEAIRIHERIQRISKGQEENLLPALETEWGRSLAAEAPEEAERHFRSALDRRPDYAPAHLGLGACQLRGGEPERALDHLEQAVDAGPPWALAALGPLAAACRETGSPDRLESACGAILARDPRAWRAHLALARVHLEAGAPVRARDALARALRERPGSPSIQRQLWELLRRRGEGIEEFVGMLDEAVDDSRLVDPFVCLRCRFKSAELYARCPHCHEWNTMSEERWE